MENIKLLFIDSSNSSKTLEIQESGNEIFISMNHNNDFVYGVFLNRKTAIRLVRELKKQIGNLKTEE